MAIYMNSKFHKELNLWKDKYQKSKKELDALIPETLTGRKKILFLEKSLRDLTKEKESIEETLATTVKKLEELLEEKEITKGQKMVLLLFAGTLDSINKLETAQGNKVKFIAQLIGANEKNIEKDFNGRGFHIDSPLSNKSNYTYMEKICKELEITEWIELVRDTLNKIKDK